MDIGGMISIFLLLLVVAVILAFGLLYIVSKITPWPIVNISDLTKPCWVYDASGIQSIQFPNLLNRSKQQAQPPTCYLSVIVPAMNERARLPLMLDDCLTYLEDRMNGDKEFSYEVIVVDDGSSDNTADIAFEYTKHYTPDKVRVLKLAANRGKGGAVRFGTMHARGQLIMFADADGATRFSDVSKLEDELRRVCGHIDWTCPSVVVGSRAHLEQRSIATRSLFRTILMVGFHLLVRLFTVRTIRDTQCGFKMFTRAAALQLFTIMHIERWAFDVELLFIAEQLHIPIAEVGVAWNEVDGSKLTPVWSWIEMGRDLLLIWFRYALGIWKFESSLI